MCEETKGITLGKMYKNYQIAIVFSNMALLEHPRKSKPTLLFLYNRWWNPDSVSVKEHLCNQGAELLAVSVFACCLKRHFTIVTCQSFM